MNGSSFLILPIKVRFLWQLNAVLAYFSLYSWFLVAIVVAHTSGFWMLGRRMLEWLEFLSLGVGSKAVIGLICYCD